MTEHALPTGAVLALAGALVLDATLGEPPGRLHPVAAFGTCVGAVDREWRSPRAIGLLVALLFPVGFALFAGATVGLAGRFNFVGAVVVAALVLFIVSSLRRLTNTAERVSSLTTTDLDAARTELRALAGRDAETLTTGQVRSAVVESLPENLSDGLVAPLSGFVLGILVACLLGFGSAVVLAVGAGCAAWVKGVNTLDSMLGYRDHPMGWASARLDDAVMWLPARVTAVLLGTVALRPDAVVAARHWLDDVPSPNAGWPMGTLAAILSVRLEKSAVYTLNPTADLPTSEDTTRAIRVVSVTGVLAYILAAFAVGVGVWY